MLPDIHTDSIRDNQTGADIIPETEAEYVQIIRDRKKIVGKLNSDLFGDDIVEIIPDYQDGELTGFVSAQTWGTSNPHEDEGICIDDILSVQIIETWKP